MSAKPLSFRPDPKIGSELRKIAAHSDRPLSWHLEQAVAGYVDLHRWQLAHIEEGIADLDAGRIVSHDQVAAYLRSWGRRRRGRSPRRSGSPR